MSLFSINTIAFTWLGYSMSWIELIGTIFNIWCVWLAARKQIWTWPVGLVGIILYFFLFYQIQLYSDMGEQIYYFFMTFVGWAAWRRGLTSKETFVHTLTWRARSGWVIATALGTALLVYITTHLTTWLPNLFTAAPAYPWIDAGTTVISFVATYLMAKRYLDCWPLWILVDVIAIWLYYVQGVKFISLEYVLFLGMATFGFIDWHRTRAMQSPAYADPSLASA